MKRINTHLTVQQVNLLKKLADKSGLKMAELIRRAIDKYLEINK